MVKTENAIKFGLSEVVTEQFAIIEEHYQEGEAVDLVTTLRFGCHRDNKIVMVGANFIFENNQKPFLVIEGSCFFKIAEETWDAFIDQENKVKLEIGFVSHLAVITIGTTRGILHSKTENTLYNKFIIPTINVSELIKEDIYLEE